MKKDPEVEKLRHEHLRTLEQMGELAREIISLKDRLSAVEFRVYEKEYHGGKVNPKVREVGY